MRSIIAINATESWEWEQLVQRLRGAGVPIANVGPCEIAGAVNFPAAVRSDVLKCAAFMVTPLDIETIREAAMGGTPVYTWSEADSGRGSLCQYGSDELAEISNWVGAPAVKVLRAGTPPYNGDPGHEWVAADVMGDARFSFLIDAAKSADPSPWDDLSSTLSHRTGSRPSSASRDALGAPVVQGGGENSSNEGRSGGCRRRRRRWW